MKFDYNEVYRILNELKNTGSSIGNSIYRDTVNYYWQQQHSKIDPLAIIITDTSNDPLANYSIKHEFINASGNWQLI